MSENLPTATGNPMEDFKQRVLDKLKNDIGSLMPDAVLAGLVQQAVKDTFFTERTIPKPDRGGYSTETIKAPSWFMQEVTTQIEPKLKDAVKLYVETNRDMIDATIRQAMSQDKLMFLMAVVMGDRLRDGLSGVAREFVQEMQNQGYLRRY